MFFVPYVWDMLVGTLSTTTIEWSRNKILVFPLNDEVLEPLPQSTNTEDPDQLASAGHGNADEVV